MLMDKMSLHCVAAMHMDLQNSMSATIMESIKVEVLGELQDLRRGARNALAPTIARPNQHK